MMDERFAEMCNRVATDVRISLDPNKNYSLPEEYNVIASNLVKQLRPKMSRLSTLRISYIQDMFSDMNLVADILHEKTRETNGVIPEDLFAWLSYNLYDHELGINDLSDEQQAIIKVLACYIIISN